MHPQATTSRRDRPGRAPLTPKTVLALAALALAGACTNGERHSLHIGATPDDYRTNHPIVIGERDEVLDLPVGSSERGLTGLQKARFDGFLATYDRTAAPVLTVTAPVGAANEAAASHLAHDLVGRARLKGVPSSRIALSSYGASAAESAPPVRVVFTAMRAYTAGKCGRWPADIGETAENKHWANFGCSAQNNLAAQVANPADLLGPRQPSEIDAENRKRVIDAYQNREITGEFIEQSEIAY
ncbi:MAG TPA: CpaD family pilus assembly lipoprotein [Mesorhizobium sp.]|jgi:pilus assembly protein CpaD|nr:CpaD family pilus assembly lipoprotein [Mesorhizobium sp.]